jgi:hypothetical protein
MYTAVRLNTQPTSSKIYVLAKPIRTRLWRVSVCYYLPHSVQSLLLQKETAGS